LGDIFSPLFNHHHAAFRQSPFIASDAYHAAFPYEKASESARIHFVFSSDRRPLFFAYDASRVIDRS